MDRAKNKKVVRQMVTFIIIWLFGVLTTGYIVWEAEGTTEATVGDILLALVIVTFLWPAALIFMAHCYWIEHLRQKVVDVLNTKVKIKGETSVRNSNKTDDTAGN